MSLPTASDNIFPKLILVEGAAPASPSASDFKLYVDSSDHLLKMKNSSGTVTTFGTGLTDPMTTRGDIIIRNSSNSTARLAVGSAGTVLSSDGTDVAWSAASGGGVLAVHRYANGSDATLSTITATTMTDWDSTNAAVTFTAPASGNIIIKFSCMLQTTVDNKNYFIGLRESTTTLDQVFARYTNTALVGGYYWQTFTFYLTGVSAGSHTYKAAGYVQSGGSMLIATGPTNGALVLEVLAAP